MKSFKEFIEEATKEMTLKQVMKKINDGYWEAEQDMKVGRHAILRDIKTKKRITVYIKEDLNEEFKTGDYVKHTKSGVVGKIVNVSSDKAAVDVKWNSGKTTTTDPKKLSKFNLKEDLSEATQEKDLDPKKKIVVKGVKGMKSKPFVKKFRNMDAYDKWTDSDEFGDFEVHQIMNESEDLEEDEKTNTEGSMKSFSEYLEEAEVAGRAWKGKLERIDKLMAWMYDKDILTKGEKNEKDKVFRQYYRYHNDGDFPRGITKTKGVSAYENAKYIEQALEEYLDDFIKKILKKYMPKIDRTDFRYDKVISDLKVIKDSLDRNDMHSFFNYYSKKTTIQDDEHGTYSKLYSSLNSEFNDLVSATNSIDKASSNYTIAYRRDLLKKAGTWNKDLEKKWIAVEDLCNKLSNFIENVISSINKMKTLRQLDKE